jgi:hypothetical protein
MTETQMQHHFGWKSASMVLRYTRQSANLKQSMAAVLNVESGQKTDQEKTKCQSCPIPGTEEKREEPQRNGQQAGGSGDKRKNGGETDDGKETAQESPRPNSEEDETSGSKKRQRTYIEGSETSTREGLAQDEVAGCKGTDTRASGEAARIPSPSPTDAYMGLATMLSGWTVNSSTISVTICQGPTGQTTVPSITIDSQVKEEVQVDKRADEK